MRHQEADRIPHLEFWVTSQSVFEYVLEKPLDYAIVDAALGGQSITPEDHVEFAGRLGMDAVVCNFNWRPNNVMRMASDGTEHYVDGSIKREADLPTWTRPRPSTRSCATWSATSRPRRARACGVFANFTSFFDSAMLAVGVSDSFLMFYDNRPFLEKLMDILLAHQEKVMQAVCDEFAGELAFILVNDDIAHNAGLMINPDMFLEIFPQRMKRLIAPAKAAASWWPTTPTARWTRSSPSWTTSASTSSTPSSRSPTTSSRSSSKWGQRFTLVGNIPTVLLAYGPVEEIEERVTPLLRDHGAGRRLRARLLHQHHGGHPAAELRRHDPRRA